MSSKATSKRKESQNLSSKRKESQNVHDSSNKRVRQQIEDNTNISTPPVEGKH
jgi:hypothetical protein